MTRHAKGVLCIIISAFCFALMNMFVRAAGDLPSIEKSFFRNAVAAIFAAVIVLKDHSEINIRKNDIPLLILRSVMGTVGIICNYYAVDHLVLSDASMLNKMSPFFTIIFSWLFLSERISLKKAVMIICAFIGSLLVIKPSFSNAALGASIIGFIGGLGAGSAYTCVRALGKRGVKGPAIVLFFSAFSCAVTLPYLLFFYQPMTGYQLLMLLFAGFAAAGGQFSITAAYTYAPASEISIYDYSQIIFAAILGFIAFQQIPDTLSVIGYAIIIAMALLMFIQDRKSIEPAAR